MVGLMVDNAPTQLEFYNIKKHDRFRNLISASQIFDVHFKFYFSNFKEETGHSLWRFV